MRCAGLHRKVGTHITKVKSLSMDSWSNEQVEVSLVCEVKMLEILNCGRTLSSWETKGPINCSILATSSHRCQLTRKKQMLPWRNTFDKSTNVESSCPVEDEDNQLHNIPIEPAEARARSRNKALLYPRNPARSLASVFDLSVCRFTERKPTNTRLLYHQRTVVPTRDMLLLRG